MSVCEQCKGVGKLEHNRIERNDAGEQIGASYGSRLCPCRRDLPPRDGTASWWTLEVVHREDWTSATGSVTATFEVECEVPLSADNYRLHRVEENVYYPAMAKITLDRDEMPLLLDSDLEDFAAAIQRCRDAIAATEPHAATTQESKGDSLGMARNKSYNEGET